MIYWLSAFAVAFFGASVFFEMLSAVARPAGAIVGMNSMGYTLNVLINTIKRIFMVIYPPIIGLISTLGGVEAVTRTIVACLIFSAIPMYVAMRSRDIFLIRSAQFILLFSRNIGLIAALVSIFSKRAAFEGRVKRLVEEHTLKSDKRSFYGSLDVKIFLLASWVLGFYTIAIFAINLAGAHFSEYGAVIYQLVGLVNAVGTLVWSFILDPIMSRRFDAKKDVIRVRDSVLFSNWMSNFVIAPVFLVALHILLTSL